MAEPEPQLVISAPAPGGNLISAPRLRFRNTAFLKVADATLFDFIRFYTLYNGIGTIIYNILYIIYYFAWNLRCGWILETPFLQTFFRILFGHSLPGDSHQVVKTLLHAGVSGPRRSRWKHHHQPGSGHHF